MVTYNKKFIEFSAKKIYGKISVMPSVKLLKYKSISVSSSNSLHNSKNLVRSTEDQISLMHEGQFESYAFKPVSNYPQKHISLCVHLCVVHWQRL